MHIHSCAILLWCSVVEESENGKRNVTGQWECEENVFPLAVRILIVCVYGILMLWGIATNCVVCYVVFSKQLRKRLKSNDRCKASQKPFNFHVAILAISDLIICLICLPISAMLFWMGCCYWTPVACKFLHFAHNTLIVVSSINVAAIAFNRYTAIVRSTSKRWNRKCGIVFKLLLIWLFALSIASPLLLKYSRSTVWSRIHVMALLCVQFLAPVLILTVAHLKIVRHINVNYSSDLKNRENTRKRNIGVTDLLESISIIFTLSWLPLTVFTMLIEFYPYSFDPPERWVHYAFLLCHLAAVVSTGINPILYGYLNTNLRKKSIEIFSRVTSSISSSQNQKPENSIVL